MAIAHPSISAAILVYNDEKTILRSVSAVISALEKEDFNYEILIIDDSSIDNSWQIIQQLGALNPKTRIFQSPKNIGPGWGYQTAIRESLNEYIFATDGDNRIKAESLEFFFREAGIVDIVTAYIGNQAIRPIARRFISSIFTFIMNLLFDMELKYFNGPSIIRASLLKALPMSTPSSLSHAEALIYLIKQGHKYKELPIFLNPDLRGTNLLRGVKRNFWTVTKAIFNLFIKIKIRNDI